MNALCCTTHNLSPVCFLYYSQCLAKVLKMKNSIHTAQSLKVLLESQHSPACPWGSGWRMTLSIYRDLHEVAAAHSAWLPFTCSHLTQACAVHNYPASRSEQECASIAEHFENLRASFLVTEIGLQPPVKMAEYVNTMLIFPWPYQN